MEEYADILTLVLLTAITIGVVGLIIAGGVMIYKFLKDEY